MSTFNLQQDQPDWLIDYDFNHTFPRDWECLIYYKNSKNENVTVGFNVNNRQDCQELFNNLNNALNHGRTAKIDFTK